MEQYRTIQGDTWDLIAKKCYGNEKKMDVLMGANFLLLDYVVFPAGVFVNVPVLDRADSRNLPEWRKG